MSKRALNSLFFAMDLTMDRGMDLFADRALGDMEQESEEIMVDLMAIIRIMADYLRLSDEEGEPIDLQRFFFFAAEALHDEEALMDP